MVIALSAASDNEEETLCSLRFGQRAKMIKNTAKINKQLTVEECKRIIDELQKKLDYKQARIEQLEKFILDNGLKLPTEEELQELIEKKEKIDHQNDQPLTDIEKEIIEKEHEEEIH